MNQDAVDSELNKTEEIQHYSNVDDNAENAANIPTESPNSRHLDENVLPPVEASTERASASCESIDMISAVEPASLNSSATMVALEEVIESAQPNVSNANCTTRAAIVCVENASFVACQIQKIPCETAIATSATATATPVAGTTTTTIPSVAAMTTSAAATTVVPATNSPHLPHVDSALVFGSSVQLRSNQQQQQKIKSYHDAKQTALWDTKSSTTSGGAILKCGLSSAYGSPTMVRKTSESAATGNLPRRVSFPKSDSELVTGYLEPANPWEHVSAASSSKEIADLYVKSCHRHNTVPLPDILDQLKAVELNKLLRQPLLSLNKIQLLPGDCEALEEILKRVQYNCIDLSSCELEECAVSALCEIIEYYEAATELNISSNPKGMTHRGWSSCAYMVGHSQFLQVLNAQGNPISKTSAESLGQALSTSSLHTIKLEHCGLKGAPLSGLCLKLRYNKVLRELWLAHNDLDCSDAECIAALLKVNHYLELVDVSNNNIGDEGLKHIVEALIVQSKELERRSTMFQRAAAIDDDILSPEENAKIVDQVKPENSTSGTDYSDLFDCNINASSNDNNNKEHSNGALDDGSKKRIVTESLIPELDDYSLEIDAITSGVAALSSDDNEAEEDTEDTVKSNTIKNPTISASGGQSMLDKLLSMNSDSSSEEGASNLSTDTIAACGSDDTSCVSDDIFDAITSTTATSTTNTCTNNSKVASATLPTTVLSPIRTGTTIPFDTPAATRIELIQNREQIVDTRTNKSTKCDNCIIEANNHCECNGDKKPNHPLEIATPNYHNNNNNRNNNNNNTSIIQNEHGDFKETAHNHDTSRSDTKQCGDKDDIEPVPSIFEVTAEERDCLVPCTSDNKPNPTSAVDVNKNTRLGEDYDDTHSTDSAFESASEGDISRHLPEEFGRFSASLESTRLDDIAKELAIETATIATESTESLVNAGVTPRSTPTLPPTESASKLCVQTTGASKVPDIVEVRFNESVSFEPDASGPKASASNLEQQECLIPKVTIESDSVSCVKLREENKSPIPTPPPPSTSPGGAGLSMRRTDSSCNFIAQATRNHSQSSDSLCSDNSLDGSMSSDLNISTSAQLNEKFTKNDTLTRQQRQCDTLSDNSNRAPSGLKALAVWNNNLTKEAGLYVSNLLADTGSLELLNIGKNCLSNEFVFRIKESLTKNSTLTTFGLQSAHLSAKGIETLSSVLAFGGNSTLQRIDIRDNKLEVESLSTLAEALKSNTTVTQIDIDDEPKRLSVGSEAHFDYTRVVENVRSMCSRNEKTQSQLQAEKSANMGSSSKRRGYYVGSRKISLTCHSRPLIEYSAAPAVAMPPPANKLEVRRKTGVRLRSPVPSPPTISPSSSPNRSRFQVFRVPEVSPLTSPLAQTPPPPAAITASNSVCIQTLSHSADCQPSPASGSLTTSSSLPSMTTVTSATQTIKRQSISPRSRFHVSKIYEDPKVPLAKRFLPPITPPIILPPTPMMKFAPKETSCSTESENIQHTHHYPTEKHDNETQTPPSSTSSKSENAAAVSSIQKSRCPIAVFSESSNDITLTHDSAREILSNTAALKAVAKSTDSIVAEVKDESATTATEDSAVAQSAAQVARKSSWIANPTAVDQILTLFRHPTAIFQRSSSPEPKCAAAAVSVLTASENTPVGATIQSTRQAQNSMFKQSKLSTDILNLTVGETEKSINVEQSSRSFLDAASKQFLDFGKQVFRPNSSSASESNNPNVAVPAPITTISSDVAVPYENFINTPPTDLKSALGSIQSSDERPMHNMQIISDFKEDAIQQITPVVSSTTKEVNVSVSTAENLGTCTE